MKSSRVSFRVSLALAVLAGVAPALAHDTHEHHHASAAQPRYVVAPSAPVAYVGGAYGGGAYAAGDARYQAAVSAGQQRDLAINAQVQRALLAAGFRGVQSWTSNGVAVLRGAGLTRAEAGRAAAIVAAVPGVTVVRDEIAAGDAIGYAGGGASNAWLAERTASALRAAGIQGVGARVHVNADGGQVAAGGGDLSHRVAQALRSSGVAGGGGDVRVYQSGVMQQVRVPVYGEVPVYATGSGMAPIVSSLPAKSKPKPAPVVIAQAAPAPVVIAQVAPPPVVPAPAPPPAIMAPATEVTDIRRLGGANAICRGGVTTLDEMQRWVREVRPDFERILGEAAWPGQPEDLFRALESGAVVEITYPAGSRFQWMALRRDGRVVAQPELRWAGEAPMPAFEVQFDSGDYRHTFALPKPCCNLALVGMERRVPVPKASIRLSPSGDCIGNTITVDASASRVDHGELAGVRVEERRPDGQTTLLGPADAGVLRWKRRQIEPGTYTYSAVALADGGVTSAAEAASVELRACPPRCDVRLSSQEVFSGESFEIDGSGSSAVVGELSRIEIALASDDGGGEALELTTPWLVRTDLEQPGRYVLSAVAVDDLGQRSPACRSSVDVISRVGLFLGAYAGTERRWRGGRFDGDFSAPLVAPYGGVGYMLSPRVELAGVLGAALNTRHGDSSSLFADVELNYLGDGYFLGGGAGWWDFNHGDADSGSLLVQGGFDLPWKVNEEPSQFVLQGRLLTDHGFDHPDNNYVLWGGVRIPLTRNRKLAKPFTGTEP